MGFIDLRSDTVSMPTEEMRQAMMDCEVGDDGYGDDPTVNKLERMAAERLGKEAAVFVSSGVMGNQVAIMTHTNKGDKIIVAEEAHIVIHEEGFAERLSSVGYCLVNNPNGYIYASDVEKAIHAAKENKDKIRLLCLENPLGNGQVVPLNELEKTYHVAKTNHISVHLDGARIFNAAAALQADVKEIAKYGDSVTFCVSKGLCAPVGSLLCGTKEFVDRARQYRRMLGGSMRQAGILAACGIVALTKMTDRLHVDHENARYLAKRLREIENIDINCENVQINLVYFKVNKSNFDKEGFVQFMYKNNVKVNGPYAGELRFATHNGINKEHIDTVIPLMKEYFL